jgi:hypothetical protein
VRRPKYWKNKAKWFSDYARDDYNEGRALLATLGSAGITFCDDIKRLVIALRDFGDNFLADLIERKDYMFPCGSSVKFADTEKIKKGVG